MKAFGLFNKMKLKKKLPDLNENKQPVHMRYHLFLQYGWFLQNLGKDFIRTNMHTTVQCTWLKSAGMQSPQSATTLKILTLILSNSWDFSD